MTDRAGGWILRGAACRRYRPVLVDLVDRGERGPLAPAALDHLGGCERCRDEITEVALTVAALRRAGAAYRALPTRPLPRPALPAPRRPWAWRAQLGGLITSAGIAALLVAPQVGLMPAARAPEVHETARSRTALSWQVAERQIAARPDSAPVAAVGTLPPRYPDGLMRPWKEVHPTDATARGLDPE